MRAQPYRDVDIGKVRAHARDLVETTSLRSVAPLIPILPSTLHNFLKGAAPHPRIRNRLCGWYLREIGDGAEARAALHLLSGYFPPAQRPRVRANVLDQMENAFRDGGRQPPEWIARLRQGEG